MLKLKLLKVRKFMWKLLKGWNDSTKMFISLNVVANTVVVSVCKA